MTVWDSKPTNNLLPPPLLKIWKVIYLKLMSFLLWLLVNRKRGKVEGKGIVNVFVFLDPPQEHWHRPFTSFGKGYHSYQIASSCRDPCYSIETILSF